ncbi:MAG TPA: hypothetical protein DCQ06_07780 [Myxococcales bacterium]|nr:hypothetical protein [Myxococcales bacterium]
MHHPLCRFVVSVIVAGLSTCLLAGCSKSTPKAPAEAAAKAPATPKAADRAAPETNVPAPAPKGLKIDPNVKVDERAVVRAAKPKVEAPAVALSGRGTGELADVQVQLRFEPAAPKVGQMFTVHTHITRAGKPVGLGDFKVDSTMPDHGHGMMTKPQHKSSGPGLHSSEGFKLHMHGKWVFEVTGQIDGKELRIEMPWNQAPEAL